MGADGIELDVHATADAAFVVVHDEVLGGAPIPQLTLRQVRSHALPNGEPVPTLAEALSAIGAATTVFIEVKTLPPGADASLLQALERGPAPPRYHVHSFDHRVIQRLQRRAPTRIYGVLSCSYPVDPLAALRSAGATELWQHDSLIDEDLVRGAHDAGCKVYAWTVDDAARMSILRRFGVDGICTNQPDIARSALG
jgi:glycerophosphoryl diester phosphodiesterase